MKSFVASSLLSSFDPEDFFTGGSIFIKRVVK